MANIGMTLPKKSAQTSWGGSINITISIPTSDVEIVMLKRPI